MDERGDSLVGCKVVLNPKMSGMYIDPSNHFTLSFFTNGKDRINLTKEMETTFIRKNIKAGILFVFDGGKDVTQKFGGPLNEDWSRKPIVKASLPVNSKSDDRYLQVLDRNNQALIIQDIRSIKDLPTLERIEELERKGNNPSAQGRGDVLKAIKEQMKQVYGVGTAKELDDKKEEIDLI